MNSLLKWLLDKDTALLANAGILDDSGVLTIEGGMLALNILVKTDPKLKAKLIEIAKEVGDKKPKTKELKEQNKTDEQ